MRLAIAWKCSFAVLLVAILFGVSLAQQPPSAPPKYDLATEMTLKGSVEEVKEVTMPQGPAIHLMVRSGAQIMEVYLCPNAFLKEMEFNFTKGDQVQVIGSKVKVADADVLLAKEVTRGNDTLTLRDKKGTPVWAPLKKG